MQCNANDTILIFSLLCLLYSCACRVSCLYVLFLPSFLRLPLGACLCCFPFRVRVGQSSPLFADFDDAIRLVCGLVEHHLSKML